MYFDSQAHSSHNESKGVETPTPKFCAILPGFSEILPRFLTNQNFWGALASLASYTTVGTGLEIETKSRDSITAIQGVEYRHPTNSLAICTYYSY